MTYVNISGYRIEYRGRTFVIAEIGSNHDGSLERARELIHASREAGADAVKFQSFTAEGLLNPYKLDNGTWKEHPAYDVIRRLSLPVEWHHELKQYADALDVVFLSAPFDTGFAALLDEIGVPAFKVASGDLTNLPLLRNIAGYGKPMIISTGAAYIGEVEKAIQTVRESGNGQVAILHCASLYPPKFSDANVRVVETLYNAFHIPVGYSDHTPGWTVPLAAVTLGACIIEKHITFSRDLAGPDHPYALEVDEFREMVKEIRNLEEALGDGIKRPAERELDERIGARRSIYAAKDISKGSVITEDMLKLVRHAYGLAPEDMELLVGKRASRDITKHELISIGDAICQ